jgi:hypothetical protein
MDISKHLESVADAEFFRSIESPALGMTHAQLRSLLDSWGVKYRTTQTTKRDRDGGLQFDFVGDCPLCGHSEGNPAAWLYNGTPCFKCFWADPGCDDVPKKTFADLKAHFSRPALDRFTPIPVAELVEKYKIPRPQIVKGLIRRGEVVNIVATPKMRKSWFAMQLGLSVVNGVPFLGFETVPGPVLIVDCELQPDDLAARLFELRRVSNLPLADDLRYISLRGQPADIFTVRRELAKLTGYALIVLDPMYKLLPSNCDENSNSDMTRVFCEMDAMTVETGATVINIHHGTKGAQSHKSAVDMGAGAGSQGRSADVAIALKPHEERNVVVMEASFRSQRPIDPLCLEFEYPLWRLAPDKNPAHVATATKKPVPTLDAFLRTIPAEPTPKTEALAWSKETLCTSKTTVQALLHEAIKRGLVEVERPRNLKLPHTIRRVSNPKLQDAGN